MSDEDKKQKAKQAIANIKRMKKHVVSDEELMELKQEGYKDVTALKGLIKKPKKAVTIEEMNDAIADMGADTPPSKDGVLRAFDKK